MFQFNFSVDGERSIANASYVPDSEQASSQESQLAEEVPCSTQDLSIYRYEEVQLAPGFSIWKGFVSSQAASCFLRNGQLAVSDLVLGKYEGGFKLWECAVDLARFLCREWQLGPDLMAAEQPLHPEFEGKQVLELGCGHGLPGILALLCGMEVHFQDYNREVLLELTAPNAAANLHRLHPGRLQPLVRLFAGDWASFPALLDSKHLCHSYDYIFSTDTIYSLESQNDLFRCIQQCLKPGGKAYIGAKSFYFGVGGGCTAFRKMVMDQGSFAVSTVAVLDDGASNKREILLLRASDP